MSPCSDTTLLKDKSILLVITGGIAAYKSLELIRLLKKSGADVKAVLTKGGSQFVTPLSVSALCEQEVHTDLWSLKDESEMGHIRLSRDADLVVIAPASADFIAKMAGGFANDLASAAVLASDKKILVAPAMNVRMWDYPATQRNLSTLQDFGMTLIGPEEGTMACGEVGMGRVSEPETIFQAICQELGEKPLAGRKALVTSGPTFEALDPVRFIGNRSSGKQGHAIAAALRHAGAEVTLIKGPVAIPDPHGVNVIGVESAQQMLAASENALPADIAICAAAVSDWRSADEQCQKIKKCHNDGPPSLCLTENPDILKTISQHDHQRPELVIGFAAETENLIDNALSKLSRKGCNWIVANLVQEECDETSTPKNKNKPKTQKVFGAEKNQVYLVKSDSDQKKWDESPKHVIAGRLVDQISEYFQALEATIETPKPPKTKQKKQDKQDTSHASYTSHAAE